MIKRIAYYTTIILATLIGLFLLWQFRDALILFIFSLVTAAAARPLVDWITGRKLPRSLGLILVYIGILGFLSGIFVITGPAILKEITSISDRFAMWYEQIWKTWPQGTDLERSIIKSLPAPTDLYKAIAGPQGVVIGKTFLGFTVSSITISSEVIAVLVLSIYWSIDQVHFERLWLSLLPVEQRAHAREIWRAIEYGVGAYIRSEVLQSILAGLLLGAGFTLIGLDYPVLLAIFGAIAWLLPWLGVVVALIPVIWVGLTISPMVMAMSVLYTVLVLLFLEVLVEPRVYSRRQYSSLLTILLIIALADSFGITGIILAPPLAAAIQILYTRLVINRPKLVPVKVQSIEEIDSLVTRLQYLRELADQTPQEDDQSTKNLIERLDRLIHRAQNLISTEE